MYTLNANNQTIATYATAADAHAAVALYSEHDTVTIIAGGWTEAEYARTAYGWTRTA